MTARRLSGFVAMLETALRGGRKRPLRLRRVASSAAIAGIVGLALPGSSLAAGEAGAGRVDSGAYSSAEGTYPWLAYVPAGWQKGDHWPLYVMLHGCATTPYEQMMADAMNPIADRKHVLLLTSTPRLRATSRRCSVPRRESAGGARWGRT
jgi:poly(3-hydroxybutyrate) depolymerase